MINIPLSRIIVTCKRKQICTQYENLWKMYEAIQSAKMKHLIAKSIAKVIRLGESNGKDMPYIIYWRKMVIWIDSVCHRVTWVEVMIGISHRLFLG